MEYTYPQQYVNEGASGSLGSPCWPFMKNGAWYTMMMRVWEPAGATNAQSCYIGRWIKEVSSGQWHLYGIMRLPVPGSSFQGNNGFLEDVGNVGRSVRSLYRRLGYYRKAGEWRSSNKVTINVDRKNGQFDNYWVVQVKPEGDHEFLAMELSWNPALMPLKLSGAPLEFGKQHLFSVKQPAQPALDKPQVASLSAESNGRQVLVKWELAATSSPQFLYRIEVFNNTACQGAPIAVRQERMPTVRTVLLDAVAANPTVRFSMTDVFDQAAEPRVVAAKAAAKPSPATSATMAQGLSYELLHKFKDDAKLSLAEMGVGKLLRQGVARGFDTSLAVALGRRYAFRFKGFLRAPAGGLYVLRMQGSDGYRISVDGREALAWDGPHGPAERAASANLAKGDHALAVDYFVDTSPSPFFKLEWEGHSLPRQEIPLSALVHEDAGQTPVATLTTSGGSDGNAALKVDVNARGHAINKAQLFLGTMQIAESADATLTYAGPMLEGTNTVWVRVTYDNNCTMDSQPTALVVKGPPMKEGWALSVVGE
ncbi:MAG: PA14 domain-containing protein, partial [Kiritimatiellaeota bacterium]|nr:PA14 domain-containing protein [Kiritimatiellota bacterium]